MFEDFHPGLAFEDTRRRGGSLAAAVLLYGGVVGAVVIATATVKVKEVIDDLPDVVFVPPAPEPPPPSEAAAPAVAGTSRERTPIKRRQPPPKEIANEKLSESDRELPAQSGTPIEGSSHGVASGQGDGAAPPPAPKIAPLLVPPVPIASTFANRPRYPAGLRRKGVQGLVVVALEVTETGRARNVRRVSGPPELTPLVIEWSASWRYRPGTRDGKPIAWPRKESVRFHLEDP